MKIEKIIDCLNENLKIERNFKGINAKGHFVLHKLIEPHETFKAYKKYTYTLWYIQDRKKYRIISTQIVDKVLTGHEEDIIHRLEMELVLKLFQFIQGVFYKKLLNGEYNGNSDE